MDGPGVYDVTGTVEAGWDDASAPVSLSRISTQRGEMGSGPVEPLKRLYELIESIWPKDAHVETISVAVPGPVNPFSGVLLGATFQW